MQPLNDQWSVVVPLTSYFQLAELLALEMLQVACNIETLLANS